MQQTMKRLSLPFKPLFGLFCKPKSQTDDIDIDSVPKITIIPPLEDVHVYMDEDGLGNLVRHPHRTAHRGGLCRRCQITRDVQHFPVVDAIAVAHYSTAVELQTRTQTIDESRLTVPTFKSPRRIQPEESKPEPKLKSLSSEQRRKFIAGLPPPPPPPINLITIPPLPPTSPHAESVGELPSEPLSWTGLFQDDLPENDDSYEDSSSSSSSSSGSEPEKLSIDQFLVLCLLGKGAQGDVYLVKHRAKMVFYALKAVPKSASKNGYYGNLFTEQFALRVVAGDPRFVNLQGTFQDDKYFYILTVSSVSSPMSEGMRESYF